ncbi:MAG: 6-phosphofructokinase [Myxococcota bacterium]
MATSALGRAAAPGVPTRPAEPTAAHGLSRFTRADARVSGGITDVMGVASTIDDALVGSDLTLGAKTALDVALESIDRLA